MKKLVLILNLFLFLNIIHTKAQILNVPQVIQEQDQWCWAGSTKCILDFYGYSTSQCNIADYARSVITWHDFGSVNCCTNASQGCNYWNYNWGIDGSMQDILDHFGNIQSYGVGDALTPTEIAAEVSENRPFIIRWQWTSGGGHFVVGHGINGNNVSYMNPWFGEGLHISTYNWLLDDGNHTWNMTNVLTTSPLGQDELKPELQKITVAPNPGSGLFTISCPRLIQSLEITNMLGEKVLELKNLNNSAEIDLSLQAKGMYLVKLFDGENLITDKIILH